MNRILTTRRHNLIHLSQEDKTTYGIKDKLPVWRCTKCNGYYYES